MYLYRRTALEAVEHDGKRPICNEYRFTNACSFRILIMLHEKAIRFAFVFLAFFALAGSARAAPTWSAWTSTVYGATADFATLSGNWSNPDITLTSTTDPVTGTTIISDNRSVEFGIAVNYDPTQLLLLTDSTHLPQPPAAWALYAPNPDPSLGQGYLSDPKLSDPISPGPSQYFAQYDTGGIGSPSTSTPFDASLLQPFAFTFQILAAPAGPGWLSNPITLTFLVDQWLPNATSSDSFQITRNSDYTLSPVPESESYAMLLAGLGLLGFMARCRKQKEAA